MSYEKIYATVKNLPPTARRFAACTYYSSEGKCACVLGVLFPELTMENKKYYRGIGIARAFRMYELANNTGATVEELESLQAVNDGIDLSEETRYEKVLAWLYARCEYTHES